MKKIIQVAGYLSAGVASTATLCEAASYSAADGSRPWSISASVKGFYDDNIYARRDKFDLPVLNPDGTIGFQQIKGGKVDSFGFDISPSVQLNLPLDQTTITAGYQYGFRWYENRDDDKYDQYHIFTLRLNHQFSPRYKLDIHEALSIAQEPEQSEGVAVGAGRIPLTFRSQGDNIANNAGLSFSAELNRALSLVLSYDNVLIDYDRVRAGSSSYEFALDRMEHSIGSSLRYQFRPTTVGLIGYEYGISDYDFRHTSDNTSHRIFAGVDHSFTSQLTGALRAGVQITDFDHLIDLNTGRRTGETSTTPFVDASLSYAYAKGSDLTIGIKHLRTATDVLQIGINPVTDAETTAAYVAVNHSFTGKFRMGAVGQFQDSSYESGDRSFGSFDEQYFSVGVSAAYRFTPWLQAEANYYHDTRNSDVYGGAVDYNRNRFFIGLRFTY